MGGGERGLQMWFEKRKGVNEVETATLFQMAESAEEKNVPPQHCKDYEKVHREEAAVKWVEDVQRRAERDNVCEVGWSKSIQGLKTRKGSLN